MADTTLAHWLRRLETIHPRAMDLGLERVGEVADKLQLRPVACPVITVAGTNGKGSTVAVMEAMLGVLGRTTGVNTSPHFLRFNERIRIAGVEAADEEITAAFEAIEQARGATTLTYFEFATLAALLVFHWRRVDLVLLEVGLGGRLDAANIIDPTVAVITRIDLDHQEWLGETRGAIAVEKAGILRRGAAAVIADHEPPRELEACVAAAGARAYYLGRDFHCREEGGSWSASLVGSDGHRLELAPRETGALLPVNICAGLQALLLLGEVFGADQVGLALHGLQPGGRREFREHNGREYVLDVAHNPAAVRALAEYLRANPCSGSTFALFSAMADKAIHDMILACAGRFALWFPADQPQLSRAASGADIAALLERCGCLSAAVSDSVEAAYRLAQETMSTGDRLVVFGSFHTVAAVMRQMQQDHGNG